MNPFYKLPIFLQWVLAILLFSVGTILMVAFFDLAKTNLLWVLSLPLLASIFMFTTTPFMVLLGVYKYLSLMLLVYNPNKKVYDLHNGTSFDYLFLMRKVKAGAAAKRIMLSYYLEGLLQIIQEIKTGDLPDSLVISGSSYFFSERTAEKLGFTIQKADSMVYFNSAFNILDLTWMYSYAHGRLRLPRLSAIKKASISGEDLLKQEAYIIKLKEALADKETSNQELR